jgi:hypothetical protein
MQTLPVPLTVPPQLQSNRRQAHSYLILQMRKLRHKGPESLHPRGRDSKPKAKHPRLPVS